MISRIFSQQRRCAPSRLTLLLAVVIATTALVTTTARAQVGEIEANNTIATANDITNGQFGDGSISPIGDVDVWRVTGASLFDLVFAYVDTAASASSRDSFLQVLRTNGTVLEEDDDDGPITSSVVAGAVVNLAGNIFYRINEFADNSTITTYHLYHAVIPADDSADEVEPNDTDEGATRMSARVMYGNVAVGDTDFYMFFAAQNRRLVAIVDEDPDNDGIFTNTMIQLIDRDGTTVLATGDNNSSADGNAVGAVLAPQTGIYFLRVQNGGGTIPTNYRLTILVNGVIPAVYGCCFPDGTCRDLSDTVCAALGGTSQSPGVLCSDADCPPPAMGACCLPDCTCSDLSFDDCAAANGRFGGNGSACMDHSCGVTIFDSRSDFDTAAPGLPVEDFEESPVAPNGTLGCGTEVDDTNMSCFAAGDILPGLRIERIGANTLTMVGEGFNFGGIREHPIETKSLAVNIISDSAAVLFPNSDVFAVGMKVMTIDPAKIDITVEDTGGTTIYKTTRFTDGQGIFFGITTNTAIGRIILDSPANELVDDIAFGGLPDSDSDGFFDEMTCSEPCTGGNTADCFDNCPDDANADQADGDSDGVGNVCDNCPEDANADQADADADGFGNTCDDCPDDPDKSELGECGCGVADTDTDGDGTPDCNDGCPDDANKTAAGECGCGEAETDTDGDGVPDCVDNCPEVANTDQADENEDGVGDACETCGLACGSGTMPLMPLMIVMGAFMRRRLIRRKRTM